MNYRTDKYEVLGDKRGGPLSAVFTIRAMAPTREIGLGFSESK